MTTVGSLLGKPFVNGVSKAVGTLNKKVLSARPSQVFSAIAALGGNRSKVTTTQIYLDGLNRGLIQSDKWTKAGKHEVEEGLKGMFKLGKDATIKDLLSVLSKCKLKG